MAAGAVEEIIVADVVLEADGNVVEGVVIERLDVGFVFGERDAEGRVDFLDDFVCGIVG